MLEILALPAREGDCLWIRWGEQLEHQLLIDAGTGGTGHALRERLDALPDERRHFELLVVTHVDRDHIGGILSCFVEVDEPPAITLGDIWFNGWVHLEGGVASSRGNTAEGLESMGPVQGERLARWLERNSWNRTFGGAAVVRTPGERLRKVELAAGLTLTVIGPTPDRLRQFATTWRDDVAEALEKGRLDAAGVSEGLEALGSDTPPVLESRADLIAEAEADDRRDSSRANGSSIALVLDYGGRRVLLAGDAFAQDLVDGLRAYSPGDDPVTLDVFKVPHHGSAKNLDRDLVRAVDCATWLVSTDGTRFKDPDSIAMARVLRDAPQPHFAFNVPSKFNRWWDNSDWQQRFAYTTAYGTPEDGITVALERSG